MTLRRHSGNGNKTSDFDHSLSAGQLVHSSIDTPRLKVTGEAKDDEVAKTIAAIRPAQFTVDINIGGSLSVLLQIAMVNHKQPYGRIKTIE